MLNSLKLLKLNKEIKTFQQHLSCQELFTKNDMYAAIDGYIIIVLLP